MTSTEQRPEGDLRGVFEFPTPALDQDPVDSDRHDDDTALSRGERLARLRGQLSVPRILRRHEGSDAQAASSADHSPEDEEFIARANGTSTQRLMTHAARAAGSYVAGSTIGGLAGRLVTGPVAEFAGWRAVFAIGAALTAVARAGS